MRGAKSLVSVALLTARPRLCRSVVTVCKSGAVAVVAAGGAASCTFLCPTVAWADGVESRVRDVRVRPSDGVAEGAEVEVFATGALTYSVRVADEGRRLLIDLSAADVAGAPAAITSPVGVVGGVLTQAFDTAAGRMTRITISLQRPASYRVVPDGATLRVILTPSAVPGRSGAPAPPARPPGPAGPVAPAPAPAPAPPVASAAGVAEGPRHPTEPVASVHDLRFERAPGGGPDCGPTGCERIVVELDKIPAYSLGTASGRLRLELRATRLPDALARTLDVTAYGGGLRSITAAQDAASGSAVVELEHTGDATGTVLVEGGRLVWSFPLPRRNVQPSPIAPIRIDGSVVGKDGGAVRRIVTVAREQAPKDLPRIETSIHDDEPTVETAGGGAAGFVSGAGDLAAQQRYTGRRIDIDLKDADIHNVLRLLADTGHVNIVTADDVGGTITIRMRNVPWDQVLDVVLQAKGLGMVRQGNLIRVAPMAQLQKERELKLAQQKQEYELTPLETRLIPISYAQADELQARAKELLSPRGSIAVDERTNVLIARDVAGNLNYIEELVRSLDTQTAQVLIEARIVEATSKYLRDVGIQWGGDVTFGPATGNPTGIAFPSSVAAAGGNFDNNTPTAGLSPFVRNIPTPNFAVNLPAAVGTGSGGALGMTFGSIDNTIDLALRLSAAESSGLVRIVSAPRIMVLDNREARINQGTLIPFAQVSALGVQTTFQEAKLQLLVRPHVTADGSVSMHVKLNRDEPDFNQTSPRGDPTILKREAETDLLVMDGHTAVIGGIYTRNTGRNLDQVPFFGDIPILGVLFQRRRASDARNELVIFITPRIVNRSEALGR
jgi:type IV pilus assembly protein PilQ